MIITIYRRVDTAKFLLTVSVVQALESSHLIGVFVQPVEELQLSVVHLSLSLQSTGV